MKQHRNFLLIIVSVALLSLACTNSDDDVQEPIDNFDRSLMLANWADNIIIPAYTNYAQKLAMLKTSATNFTNEPSILQLDGLRSDWLSAYLAFQEVSMFEIGMAESIMLRNFTNIYPTDPDNINGHIATGNYNLTLPSTNDEQGFPALDYLLYGIAETDAEIVESLSSSNAKQFLLDIVNRLNDLANVVLTDWNDNYRDVFVDNSGSSATSSVNKLTNDYMFYYEKALRAGKIGIPAGVFSGSPLVDRVEGFYSKQYSKLFFDKALDAVQRFFKGQHYGSNTTGPSLSDYLDYLEANEEEENLSTAIMNQFAAAKSMAAQLSEDLAMQVETDNTKMLLTYDELQKNVVLMKVDMFQALNIRIDFVDADGD